MKKPKWQARRVVLFASIEKAQHDALRYIAYKEARPIADIVREALGDYLKSKESKEMKNASARGEND